MASSASATLRRIARETKSVPRKAIEDAAKTLKRGIDKKLRGDTGGDNSLSGAPRRMRVQTKVTGETVVVGTVSPNKSAMAQWVWLNEGTGHPGPTAPKFTWDEPVSEEMKNVQRAIRRRLDSVMR